MKYMRVLTLLAAALLCLNVSAPAQMHTPKTMTAAQIATAQRGSPVQFMIRLTEMKRATMHGEILEHQSDGSYKTTGKYVTLYLPDGTPVVMGSMDDVTKGAVLFIFGVATAKDAADVKRVVVDTKYAKVR